MSEIVRFINHFFNLIGFGEQGIDVLIVLLWSFGILLTFFSLILKPHLQRHLLFFIAFFTCYLKKPFGFSIYYQHYRGVDDSFIFSILDMLSIGYFLFLVVNYQKRKLVWFPFNSLLWSMIIFISILSILNSPVPLYGLFSLQRFFYALLIYWVVVNGIQEKKDIEPIIKGLLVAVAFQGFIVFWDKYLAHIFFSNINYTRVYRSIGTLGWYNLLAMYINFIIPIFIALILSNTLSSKQTLLMSSILFLGIICVIFTKSRAGIVNLAGLLGMTVAISLFFSISIRKLLMIVLGILLLFLIGFRTYNHASSRFQNESKTNHNTMMADSIREAFILAAREMANNNFLGVGLNAYSWKLGSSDYFWYMYPYVLEELPDPEGWRENETNRRGGHFQLGVVHNVYYLFAAEIGWFGMFLFIIFLLRFYFSAVFLFLRTTDFYYKSILLGIIVGYTTVYLHGWVEWSIRNTNIMFTFFLISGLLTAIGKLNLPR